MFQRNDSHGKQNYRICRIDFLFALKIPMKLKVFVNLQIDRVIKPATKTIADIITSHPDLTLLKGCEYQGLNL
jgi:hypothetical protein